MKRLVVLALLVVLPVFSTITRTARGTNTEKNSDTSFTCPSADFTPASTDLIIVSMVWDFTAGLSTGPVWSGSSKPFTADQGLIPGSSADILLGRWRLTGENTSGHVVFSFSGNVNAKACFIITVSGTLGTPTFNSTVGDSSSGGTAVTTATTSCTPAVGGSCFWVASLGTEGPSGDAAPTWTNPNSAGQRAGTTGGGAATNVTMAEAFEIDSGSVTQGVDATLTTSREWQVTFGTYRDGAASTVSKDVILNRGVVVRKR
jgi:hypothetical protein